MLFVVDAVTLFYAEWKKEEFKVMINKTTQLSIEDGRIFLDMLQGDSEPNEALKNVALRYVLANGLNPFALGGDVG